MVTLTHNVKSGDKIRQLVISNSFLFFYISTQHAKIKKQIPTSKIISVLA